MKLIKFFSAAKALLRVPTYLLMVLYLLLGFAYAAATNYFSFSELLKDNLVTLLVFAVVVALWYINGTALNDYDDYEIDKVNLAKDKDRPLVTGLLRKNELLAIALITAAGALFLSGVDKNALMLTTCLLVLNWAYSLKPIRISYRGALAPLMLPLGYVVLPVSLGYIAGGAEVNLSFLAFVVCVYLQFAARIVLKDFRDVKGDKAFGKRTFLLAYGAKVVCITSIICLTVGTLGLIILNRQYFNFAAFPIMVMLGFALTMLDSLRKKKTWKEQKPLISASGRAISGILFVTIMALVLSSEGLGITRQIIIYSVATGAFIWSSLQVLDFQSQ